MLFLAPGDTADVCHFYCRAHPGGRWEPLGLGNGKHEVDGGMPFEGVRVDDCRSVLRAMQGTCFMRGNT